MKLLCIAPIRYPGHLGDAIRLPNLARFLVKNGHQVQFLIAFPKVEKEEILEIEGVIIHRYPIRHKISAPIKIHGLIKKFEYDILYAYMPSVYSSIPALLTGKPFVLDCPDILRFHKNVPFLGRSIRKAKKIFVINKITKSFYVNEYGVEDRKFVTVPNGVESKFFYPNVAPTAERSDVIFVGRLYCLDDLIHAAHHVVKEHTEVRFLIVGNGDEGRWKARVQKEGLGKNFRFIGSVPHEKVPSYIAGAKIGVNVFPNEPYYAAAQPLKLLEYMASGKPVVATNLPGTVEIVQQKSQGFLYDAERHEQFADYIVQLLEDEELRKRMGKEGVLTASKYSWTAIGEKLLKNLEQMT